MSYSLSDLPLQSLLPAVGRAEDHLARLDEVVRCSPQGTGFVERAHFFDAVAGMWITGALIHVEDLVLHDAHMDIRAPTHELTIAHAILRTRRRIANADPAWAMSSSGILTLAGVRDASQHANGSSKRQSNGGSADLPLDDDPLSAELAAIDAALERTQRLLDSRGAIDVRVEKPQSIVVGNLVVRDAEWDERGRIEQWLAVGREVADLPPTLAGAILWDAWETLEPLQNRHWLGALLVGAWFRSQRKVTSHLFCLNVGLRTVPRERRRSTSTTTRLLATLDAMSAAGDAGRKDVSRLTQAREQMQRRLHSRRSSSSLPEVIDLVLSRPIISAAMVAEAVHVTPRGALNLIAALGLRELTGRGRYRAWGII